MAFTFMMLPLGLLYLALPTALFCVVEYFLSKTESPWPGRALPIASAIFSVCVTMVVALNLVHAELWAVLVGVAAGLVIFNIPTALYLLIYRNTRRKYIEKKNMEKMNIQDL